MYISKDGVPQEKIAKVEQQPSMANDNIVGRDTAEPLTADTFTNDSISQAETNINNNDLSENADNLPESVGAMKSDPNSFYALANEHGTIEEGENPSRVVDVPVKPADGKTVSYFARTAMEAEATPDGFNSFSLNDFKLH